MYEFDQYKRVDGAERLTYFCLCPQCHDDMSGCVCVCVHTGVDLPVSLQGFLCLELGATLVTNYGLLTSWKTTRDKKVGT